MSFFSYVLGFTLKFSRIALSRKCLQLDSKSDLTTNGFFLGFSVGKWLLFPISDLYGLKIAENAQLLIVFLFWRYQISSMFSLRGILVCSLKMLLHFSPRILYYRLITFKNAKQLYFLSFVFSSLFFLEVVVKSFDYFWKSNSLFFKFCVDCLLMFFLV